MRTEFSSEKEKHNYFNRMTHEQKLDAFGEILASCRHVAFLGGAGVSTESGIPDFRSQDGLYNMKYKYPPEQYEDAIETVISQCEMWTDNAQ